MSIRQLCNLAFALLLKGCKDEKERDEMIQDLHKPMDGSYEQMEAEAAEVQALLYQLG
jgi:hypothetical protein